MPIKEKTLLRTVGLPRPFSAEEQAQWCRRYLIGGTDNPTPSLERSERDPFLVGARA